MTTFALVAGMMPVAIGLGEGAEFYSPMAVAIIGGVITSTLLTLLVIPTFYDSIEVSRERMLAKFHRRSERGNALVAFLQTFIEALLTIVLLRFVFRLVLALAAPRLRRSAAAGRSVQAGANTSKRSRPSSLASVQRLVRLAVQQVEAAVQRPRGDADADGNAERHRRRGLTHSGQQPRRDQFAHPPGRNRARRSGTHRRPAAP